MSVEHTNKNSNDAVSNYPDVENDEFYTVKELFKMLKIFINNFSQESKNPEMIERFFSHPKININAIDKWGDTVLHHAINDEYTPMIELILQHPELNIHILNIHKQDSFQLALNSHNWSYFDQVCEKFGVEFVDNNGNSMLHLLAMSTGLGINAHISQQQQRNDLFEKILKNENTNPNLKNIFEITPLQLAVLYGNIDLFNILVTHPEINPNNLSESENTLLHQAVLSRNLVMFKLVHEKFPEIDPNSKNANGDTPLHLTIYSPFTRMLELLLTLPEIDINSVNNDGDTLLHIAAKGKHTLIYELLIDNPRIDITIKNNEGLIAEDCHEINDDRYNEFAEFLNNNSYDQDELKIICNLHQITELSAEENYTKVEVVGANTNFEE